MDKFLETPRVNYEEKGILNKSVMNKEIESVMKILPIKRSAW
jgi:hypothetical protein